MLSLKKFHGYISPIPGGVGPLTVAMLINNLVNLTMIQNKIKEID
jgi:5,10-methylene-tetrahydrofolate dehydrogenase/methenyl tetrahydrofolate cyclohydrolase